MAHRVYAQCACDVSLMWMLYAGRELAVPADQLLTGEARRHSAVEPDTAAVENLETAPAAGPRDFPGTAE